MMLKQALKTAVVVATSAIAIPYAVAILANIIHGWPKRKDKFRHTLNPKKVMALNYVVLQEIAKIRFLGLMLQWKYFYLRPPPGKIVKDLPYGSHDNLLDVHIPHDLDGAPVPGKKPVVMFVYGGTWSSGSKSMYCLLCSQLADTLKAVVCCPNYTNYPKGYVDDMVQDVVDCLTWIQENAERFGGDKDRVAMLGHSAGSHLCALSVLDLTLQRLMHRPETALLSPLGISRQSSVFSDSIRFEDKHFNGSSSNGDPNLASVTTTGSFYVVGDKDAKGFEEEAKEGDKVAKDDTSGESESEDQQEEQQQEPDEQVSAEEETSKAEGGEAKAAVTVEVTEHGQGDGPARTADTELTERQRAASDLLSSVKLVIGLAGVYHIADHYEHEASRGVEDLSAMARAMYAPEHFDRLSPTLVVTDRLPDKIKLPPLLLIHGDKDKTVPMSSSLKFGRALWDKGCLDVSIAVIPGLGHHEICLDLMDPRRSWYDSVMNEILKAANKCL